jgi:hypothetical protein
MASSRLLPKSALGNDAQIRMTSGSWEQLLRAKPSLMLFQFPALWTLLRNTLTGSE